MSEPYPGSHDEMHRYLKSLGELLPASVFAKDASGRYVYVNSTFTRTADLYSPEAALGKLPSQILDRKRAMQAEEEDRRVLTKGESIINQENFDQRIGGEHRWNLISKVPVHSPEGDIVGMVGIAMDINDRKLAEQAAQRLAEELKVKNETLERDLGLARQIQRSLVAANQDQFDPSEVELALLVEQCDRVGGDLVKVARAKDGDCLVFVCDVMGHGVQAALVASLLAGQIDRIAEELVDPGSYLTELNARFTASTRNLSELVLATALCLRYSPSQRSCEYASAGHPLPLLYTGASGSAATMSHHSVQGQGALGLLEDYAYTTDTIRIDEGDTLLLYTDGLTESIDRNGQQLGLQWVCQRLAQRARLPAGRLIQSILASCKEETDGAMDDDISLLALR